MRARRVTRSRGPALKLVVAMLLASMLMTVALSSQDRNHLNHPPETCTMRACAECRRARKTRCDHGPATAPRWMDRGWPQPLALGTPPRRIIARGEDLADSLTESDPSWLGSGGVRR
jgi:hypothetical protein